MNTILLIGQILGKDKKSCKDNYIFYVLEKSKKT